MRSPLPFSLLFAFLFFQVPLINAQNSTTTSAAVITTTSSLVGLAVSMSGSVPVTFTTTVATVVTVPVTPTGRTGNTTRTTTTARSNLPTAATDVNGGGGGGAPSPGSGGRDQNGPNDDYVAGALKIVPWLTTAAGGTLAAVALLVL